MTHQPHPELAIQWQDSAPDMDYDEWLVAEVEVQRELLDDVPEGDLDALCAATDYILLIITEIQFRRRSRA